MDALGSFTSFVWPIVTYSLMLVVSLVSIQVFSTCLCGATAKIRALKANKVSQYRKFKLIQVNSSQLIISNVAHNITMFFVNRVSQQRK